eukprot:TRINITY_DN24736_c0_g1_i3.p1 TRINITY_DN24736_c0_g1~~TRINITY_DN24736_c0_g1_i3.p1  ORF type:complete len:527 (+),score=130.27 TRINITY_DN24736_c0_g1_i3:74-1582(+)
MRWCPVLLAAALIGGGALLVARRALRRRRAVWRRRPAARAPRRSPVSAPAAWGLGWGELSANLTAARPSALRRMAATGVRDASELLARIAPLLRVPRLLAASRPLRIFRDQGSGLTVALGMMAHSASARLCSALYQLQAMHWPVNVVGPVLRGLRGDAPVRSLRFRPDLAWLREGVPPHERGAVRQQVQVNWMLRKHLIFADMASQAPPDALLVLVDGGDVFAQLPPGAFAAAWLRREQDQGRGGVLLGADYGCYPFDPENERHFGCGERWARSWNLSASPCRLAPGGRGVNSGLLAGRAGDVAAYLDSFARFAAAVPRVCFVPEDQAMFFMHYLDSWGLLRCRGCRSNRSTAPRPALDTAEALFACLVFKGGRWVSPPYVRTAAAPGAPYARAPTADPPSLLHFSGAEGKRQLAARGGRLGRAAGLWGYWGALAQGGEGDAERLAAATAESEFSMDATRVPLGKYCAPPRPGRPPKVRKGWRASDPPVELPQRRRGPARRR